MTSSQSLFSKEAAGKSHAENKNKYTRGKEKSYAGSKTLPASIKEKETHWPEVFSFTNGGALEGGWQPHAPDQVKLQVKGVNRYPGR